MNASDYRNSLSPTAFSHLREHCLALDERSYFASAIWGAVFLEAFLDELAEYLELPGRGQEDLNGRIQQIQQYAKNRGPQKPSVPAEIVNRCHEIRNTRNRLVHDMGLPRKTTMLANDAQSISGALEIILDWYRGMRGPSALAEDSPAHAPTDGGGVRVFVSTITPHSQRQRLFLDSLLSQLRECGIDPVKLEPSVFNGKDPIGAVRKKIADCRGLIVVGLERTHAYFLREKEGSEHEREATHRKYTSGWLHLEAGIANALGLEVFVLCQQDLASDGILDRSWNTYPVIELSTLDEDSPALKAFLKHIRNWAERHVQSL